MRHKEAVRIASKVLDSTTFSTGTAFLAGDAQLLSIVSKLQSHIGDLARVQTYLLAITPRGGEDVDVE